MAKQGVRKRVASSRASLHAALLRPSKAVRSERPSKTRTIYVAVVARNSEGEFLYSSMLSSRRHDDGWYALMDVDKDALIAAALKKRNEFGSTQYEVWVGTLTEKVLIPTNFKLLKL